MACAANSRAAAMYLASKGADVEVQSPLCVEQPQDEGKAMPAVGLDSVLCFLAS